MRATCLIATLLLGAAAAAQAIVEEPLPAGSGWQAARIHRSDSGVWYARVAKVIEAYGAPEVIVTDDTGRLTVLSVYSGKWTAASVTPDGQWLAPSAPADVDPRVPGPEIYCAGKAGNVHRVWIEARPFAKFELRSVEIAHVAGEEFHTVLAADLRPGRAGAELLAFAISGAVYELTPQTAEDGTEHAFALRKLATLPGRVRDAVVLPETGAAPPRIVCASRSGHLLQLRCTDAALAPDVLAAEPMGLGRVAHAGSGAAGRDVLYVTRDDGVLLRFAQRPAGSWEREVIFVGREGLRGVAAGRFCKEPGRESVAVFGYGKAVQLVWREGVGPWHADTIYSGPDQGHWLTVGEFDGRNGTDELIATGFGGQVLLLRRPPGYWLLGPAIDATDEPKQPAPREPGIWRIAAKGSEDALRELSPLNYQGGFETKTLVYETLVRVGPDGRIAPALASAWRIEDDGRTFVFTLRAGATFHDGQPLTAADVAVHFHRWVGLPEHDWLRCNRRITAVRATTAGELRIELDRAHALLPDLCAINPTAIRGPGALDREGRFVRPIGSGPFAFVAAREDGRVLRYARIERGHPTGKFVDLVRLAKIDADDPLDALLRGEVDAVLSSWLVRVDPTRVAALRADPRFRVLEAPGSSMTYLSFRGGEGATGTRDVRRWIAATIDRARLVREVEAGLADVSTGWAAPSVRSWPQGTPPTREGVTPVVGRPLRISAGRAGRRNGALVAALAAQIADAGVPTEIATADDDTFDLRIDVTHGVPYDPLTTLVSRFLPPPSARNAQTPTYRATDARLAELVELAAATAREDAREAVYREIQALLDREAWVVPLFAARRVAILRAEMPAPALDHDMYRLDGSWLTDR